MERPGWIAVPGSERTPVPGARLVGEAAPEQRVEVTVLVRPGTTERVAPFAAAYGLEVVGSSPARRSVALAGPVSQMSRAFGTYLARYEAPAGPYRGRAGAVHVPAELADVVEAVFGLDDRPQARPYVRQLSVAAARARAAGFRPDEIAALYGFPTGSDGSGQKVAIVELGGGYRAEDLDAYLSALGIAPPRVTTVAVDGASTEATGDPAGPDGEVMLDVEIVAVVAPGAEIVLYFAPNTDRGFLDAITTAIHDGAPPAALSISWGAPESQWTAQALRAFDAAFADAGALGVTVCCASGDAGSTDGVADGTAHVDFPASSPHVLACGGTRLEARDGVIASETVWHDARGGASGGGVSAVFDLPAWQASASVPRRPGGLRGRGVPDVAADADPATGYRVRVDGRDAVLGGTSAVAPLWAALVARLNERLGARVGFVNPALYGAARPALRDVTRGTNGAYRAARGWDACSGLGSVDGSRLLALLERELPARPT